MGMSEMAGAGEEARRCSSGAGVSRTQAAAEACRRAGEATGLGRRRLANARAGEGRCRAPRAGAVGDGNGERWHATWQRGGRSDVSGRRNFVRSRGEGES